MKSYTDLEQSKKLAEFLPLESADMYYPYDLDSHKVLNIPVVKDNYCMPCIHCWSLSALLDVLPDDCGISKEDGIYAASYVVSNKGGTYLSDNPIDACVAMIEKLNKLNLL